MDLTSPSLNKKTQEKTQTGLNKPEAQIRALLNDIRSAIEARDLEKLMTFYAPDVVAFDIIAPLQFIGREEYKKSWTKAFESCKDSTENKTELHGLNITAGDDIAFVHALHHYSMVGKDGKKEDMWLRGTQCFEKQNEKWLITHEQFSVPVNFETKQALLDLKPDDATVLH